MIQWPSNTGSIIRRYLYGRRKNHLPSGYGLPLAIAFSFTSSSDLTSCVEKNRLKPLQLGTSFLLPGFPLVLSNLVLSPAASASADNFPAIAITLTCLGCAAENWIPFVKLFSNQRT